MKNFLTIWIIIQLLIIGLAGGIVINQIAINTYDCSNKKIEFSYGNIFISLFVPIIYFTSDELTEYVEDYCKGEIK